MIYSFVILLIICVGLLKKWQLIFYGTSEPPVRLISKKKFFSQIQKKTKLKQNENEVQTSRALGIGVMQPL